MTEPLLPAGVTSGPASASKERALREAAKSLEATFLAEMLKSAGFGENSGPFSGGPGEAQFASFQREAVATQMVKAGGIGLAESLFHALKERLHDT